MESNLQKYIDLADPYVLDINIDNCAYAIRITLSSTTYRYRVLVSIKELILAKSGEDIVAYHIAQMRQKMEEMEGEYET